MMLSDKIEQLQRAKSDMDSAYTILQQCIEKSLESLPEDERTELLKADIKHLEATKRFLEVFLQLFDILSEETDIAIKVLR